MSVTVTPPSAQLFQGESKQFSAAVQNAAATAVTWQVNQAPNGNATVGTIDSNGVYTAPTSVPNPPTVTVTAVLQSDPTKTGSSSVTILPPSSFTGQLVVSPALSSLTPSQTLQFQILTPKIPNSDVTWTANGGTITPDGSFTPPSSPGAYMVKASLPNAVGFATVEVTDFPGMLTWRSDNARSGENKWELALTPGPPGSPGAVSSSTFGWLFSCPAPADGPLDGYVYAQPLYVPNLTIAGIGTQNVVIVATEKDSVYAFDADAHPCKQLWKSSLVPAGSQPIAFPNLKMNGTDIVPFAGITGTPVIGGNTPTLYVVAATQTIASNPSYNHHLFALDLATVPPGEIQTNGVDIASPDNAFQSVVENQWPALLLDNGTVYIAFGSYGGVCASETEPCPNHGWLFGYDSSTLGLTGSFNVTPSQIYGGIWQGGGGPSADLNHNVFVATGDGTFDAGRPGVIHSYSNSLLRFGSPGGLSSASDFFTPCDEGTGQIVGTSAPVLLPPIPSQPNFLLGGSKGVTSGGSLYLVNRDNMGGFLPSPCPDSSTRVQTIPVAGPILSTPLFWNGNVYVAPGNGNLQSFSFSMTNGSLAPAFTSQSMEQLGPQGATPVISWNGTDINTAILWLIDSRGAEAKAPAILRAFDPNNLLKEIYASPMDATSPGSAGPAVQFSVPTVANGKVYVGTQTELDVYGLLQ